jgi:hypothetical protein
MAGPQGGYLIMSAILAGYLAISVGITAWGGWREIREQEAQEMMPVAPASRDI